MWKTYLLVTASLAGASCSDADPGLVISLACTPAGLLATGIAGAWDPAAPLSADTDDSGLLLLIKRKAQSPEREAHRLWGETWCFPILWHKRNKFWNYEKVIRWVFGPPSWIQGSGDWRYPNSCNTDVAPLPPWTLAPAGSYLLLLIN